MQIQIRIVRLILPPPIFAKYGIWDRFSLYLQGVQTLCEWHPKVAKWQNWCRIQNGKSSNYKIRNNEVFVFCFYNFGNHLSICFALLSNFSWNNQTQVMKRQPNISHSVKCIFHNQLWLVVEIQDWRCARQNAQKNNYKKHTQKKIHKFANA